MVDMNADSSTDVAVVWKGSSGAYWFQVYDAIAGTMTSQMEIGNNQDATQFNNNRFWLNPDPVCKLVVSVLLTRLVKHAWSVKDWVNATHTHYW